MREEGKRLSESCLWTLTQQFYRESAERAWIQSETEKMEKDAQPVPFYMTSNPLIASRWAQIVYHYYRSCQKQNQGSPFTIFELGAGTGRFAYLFVKALLELLPKNSNHPIKIILCDLSEEVIAKWRDNPLLKPYFDSGLIDSACVVVDENFQQITTSSGKKISKDAPLEGAAVFLAGYLFDTLVHEGFWVSKDQCGPLLFDVDDKEKECALARLHHAQIDYRRDQESPIDLSGEGELSLLCRHYQKELAQTSTTLDFTVPVGALNLCERLQSFAKEGTLILSGDQGYSNMTELLGQTKIEFGRHGTISLPVNYHAYARIASLRGAKTYLSATARHKFIECVQMKHVLPNELLFPLEQEIERVLNTFDVENYWQIVEQIEPKEKSVLSLELYYLLLKLGKADPINFFFWMPSIFEQLEGASNVQRAQWEELFKKIAENFFVIESSEVDLVLNAGALCTQSAMFDAAISFFQRGVLYAPSRAEFHFNLGICFLQKQEKETAALHFMQAEQIDPNFSLEARGLLS